MLLVFFLLSELIFASLNCYYFQHAMRKQSWWKWQYGTRQKFSKFATSVCKTHWRAPKHQQNSSACWLLSQYISTRHYTGMAASIYLSIAPEFRHAICFSTCSCCQTNSTTALDVKKKPHATHHQERNKRWYMHICTNVAYRDSICMLHIHTCILNSAFILS